MRKLALIIAVLAVLGGGVTETAQATHDWQYLVSHCEAPGSGWYANTGNGFFFGPQFTSDTWHSEGGGPVREMGDKNGRPMHSYSLKYIVRIAENTYRDQGPWAWPWCHSHGYI